jgi:hypothetical protein
MNRNAFINSSGIWTVDLTFVTSVQDPAAKLIASCEYAPRTGPPGTITAVYASHSVDVNP